MARTTLAQDILGSDVSGSFYPLGIVADSRKDFYIGLKPWEGGLVRFFYILLSALGHCTASGADGVHC